MQAAESSREGSENRVGFGLGADCWLSWLSSGMNDSSSQSGNGAGGRPLIMALNLDNDRGLPQLLSGPGWILVTCHLLFSSTFWSSVYYSWALLPSFHTLSASGVCPVSHMGLVLYEVSFSTIVRSGRHNKTPHTGARTTEIFVPHCCAGQNTQTRVPARSGSGEHSLLGLQTAAVSLCPHMAE